MRKDVVESCRSEGRCREPSNRVQRQPYAPLSDDKGTDSVQRAASTARSASQRYRQEGEPIHREKQLRAGVKSVILRRGFRLMKLFLYKVIRSFLALEMGRGLNQVCG